MFTTKNFLGRIQCVDGDFACIDLYLKQDHAVNKDKSFIEQIYLNKRTGIWVMPEFEKFYEGNCSSNVYLQNELQSIVDQYIAMRKKLK